MSYDVKYSDNSPSIGAEDQNLLTPTTPWSLTNQFTLFNEKTVPPDFISGHTVTSATFNGARNSPTSGYGSKRYRGYRAVSARRLRKRAVYKNGECNVRQLKISQRRIRFLQDIFTTLVDSQWRWTLLAFALSFILSWLGFAVLWWLISFTHGDLESIHLPPMQESNGWTPCVFNIYSFTSCFLFSIETQHTIGYGVRTTTEECPEAIFIMCFQSIYGVMMQAFMVGIVFAKMTRPKQRTQTLLFSKHAVVCQRDGDLCLMFRVGDMRKSHIIGANVRAQLIKTKTTKEGEILSQYQTELDVGTDGCASDLFFIWPMIVTHRINESSPLYKVSAPDMIQERFEIVVILEGTVESTGQTTQARSSYINTEILWGHRFDPVVSYNKDRQGYDIDYSKFNETTQVDTPLCSAKELADFYRAHDEMPNPDFFPTLHSPTSLKRFLPPPTLANLFYNVSNNYNHPGHPTQQHSSEHQTTASPASISSSEAHSPTTPTVPSRTQSAVAIKSATKRDELETDSVKSHPA